MDSKDYIQIRNVLQVLTVLLPIYPKMLPHYAALERRIEAICVAEKDQRHDLFALAKCYSGRLSHKRRDMINESQFHSVPERVVPSSTSNNLGTDRKTTVNSMNVNDHPILSDNQSAASRTTAKESSNSNSAGMRIIEIDLQRRLTCLLLVLVRPTNEKPVNIVGTGNGSATATKSSSPAPTSQTSTSSTTTTTRSGTTNNTGMRQYSPRCPSKLAPLLYIYV